MHQYMAYVYVKRDIQDHTSTLSSRLRLPHLEADINFQISIARYVEICSRSVVEIGLAQALRPESFESRCLLQRQVGLSG